MDKLLIQKRNQMFQEGNMMLSQIQTKVIKYQELLTLKQKKGNLDAFKMETIKITQEVVRSCDVGFIVEENIKKIYLNIKDKRTAIQNVLLELLRCIPILQSFNDSKRTLNIFKLNNSLDSIEILKYQFLEKKYYYLLVKDRKEKETEKKFLSQEIGRFTFLNQPPGLEAFKNYNLYEGLQEILKDLYVNQGTGEITKKEQDTIEEAYSFIFKKLEEYKTITTSKEYYDELKYAYDGYW